MYTRTTWADVDISEIARALESGHVAVGTSDTVLGLLAAATQEGFDALNRIKGRSEKPYLVLSQNREKALALTTGAHDHALKDCLHAFWPGQLTVILPASSTVSTCLQSKEQTIAVRVPNHPGLQQLLTHIPYLFSTSANRTSEPVPHRVKDIDQSIIAQCAYLITEDISHHCVADMSAHTLAQCSCLVTKDLPPAVLPSTIIDCAQRPCRILREGAIAAVTLHKQHPKLFQK